MSSVAPERAREKELDEAFACSLQTSPEMVRWLLCQTKFHPFASTARLLHDELRESRKLDQWWRHVWCNIPGHGGPETDIFLPFAAPELKAPFALHIENKPAHGKFEPEQPENYHRRAAMLAGRAKYLKYETFQTILLTPQAFFAAHTDRCLIFDQVIFYEEIAAFVPAFVQTGLTSPPGARPR
jgi:hypothetical protein